MSPLPDIFRSRVGRRVLLLFFVTALVPLVAMAALSLSQVRALLLDQASARLTNTAKAYATSVYDRLLTARDTAVLLAARRADSMSVSRSARGFLFLARVGQNGEMKVAKGVPPAETRRLVEEFRQGAARHPTLVRRTGGNKLLLLQLAGTGSAGDVLVGELDPAYVWGAEEDLKAGTILCVVEDTSFAYLHCPKGQQMNLPELLKTGGPGSESRNLVWNRDGVAYRGRLWAQFLTNDFGSPDWYVAISVPEDDVLAAVYAFRRVFFPIVLLALLLIAWLSMRQVRTMLGPLDLLTRGTRRLAANDFSTRVEVASKDEFGELGEAFNAMASALDRRFQLSTAHAEIDRLILERADLDRIVECTLRHAATLLPGTKLQAVLLDRSGAASARLLRLESTSEGAGDMLLTEPIPVSADSRPKLSSRLLARYDLTLSAAGWLRSAAERYPGPLWMCPLDWGKTECGWLLVSCPEDEAFNDECLRMIDSLANRLAVAVASAWRDDELFQRAHFDSLTGLPNRSAFGDRLQQEIGRCRRDGSALAVMFIDLDHFKSVNDSQGHSAGDVLLCEAATRLRATVRESDTVSRHGGDEFAVLVTDLREQRDALPIAQNIIDALSAPFLIGGQECFLSATVGIAIFPDNGDTNDVLLKNADTAMYRAKAAGRRQAMFFEERMNAEAVARMSIDRELRRALERGELVLHYQPQVALKTGTVVSAEALIRWNHPVRGLIGPGHFIPVAEETQLICAIGRWVIEETCRQLRVWRREGLAIERVSVNVSAKQFGEPDFIDHIRKTVVEPGLAPSIEFEITESVLLERGDLLEGRLNQLSAFGCTIALDDFGTGFSSMAYLKKLPVHAVKIDRMFVDDIDRSSDSRAFVEAMIVMSHVLGKWVVAEGAERETHVAILRGLNCDLVQGYCFSKPLPAADFAAFARGFGRPDRQAVANLESVSTP